MNFAKITIITPSYNQGNYIEQTIQSVLNQSYPNLEYIIIDGGSTDDSINIIKKYEKHLSYWISEKDKGQSEAINKGLQIATGDIINWLNSDDYYQPDTLFKIAEAFRSPAVQVVCGRGRLFRNPDQTAYYSNGTDVYLGNIAKTIGWARIDQPETFFSAIAIKKMGLLDIRLHYLMDRDWWIKYLFLFNLQGIIQIPDILVNFRLHEESKTVSQQKQFQIEHDTFYYSLAKKFGQQKYMEVISQVCIVNEAFEIEIPGNYELDLVSRALNYFILLRANEFYADNDNLKAQVFLDVVTVSALAKPDQKLFYKLYFRNKYIPQSLIHLFRRK